MSYSSVVSNRSYLKTEITGYCREQYTAAIDPYKTVITVSNDPESRPYPSNPLEALTPQALQSTTKYYSGMMKYVSAPSYKCFVDGKEVLIPHFAISRSHFLCPTVNGPPPATSWEVGHRLKIKDNLVNLGVSLVEYRETAKMFHHFARGMQTAWKRYKKLKHFRIERPTVCTISAAELNATYGISPLVSDLSASVLALTDRLEMPIVRRVVTSKKEVFDLPNTLHTQDRRWTVRDRIITYIRVEPEDVTRFTLGNPLELAWEVIPFSFVLDWGFSIGDWLSSLDALKSVQSLNGTITRKGEYYHYAPKNIQLPNWKPVRGARCFHNTHQRFVITDIPLPTRPVWNPSTSWKAIKNGMALLVSLNQGCTQYKKTRYNHVKGSN